MPVSTAERLGLLRGAPLFQGLSDQALEPIATASETAAFEDGTVLANQGDEADAFFVIAEGAAEMVRDGGQVRQLGAGDYFGEIALVEGGPRTATVTAHGAVEVLVVKRQAFQRLLSEHGSLRLQLLTSADQRLRQDHP